MTYRACVSVMAAAMLWPAAVRAQAPVEGVSLPPGATADPDPVCYGFSFGAWTPALDRVAAGHDPGARTGPGAPDGRGWAVSDSDSASSLILFPAWWPAGVRVTLPGGPPPLGQTAKGTAIALVADARKRPPAAAIVVHGVPCTRAGGRQPDR